MDQAVIIQIPITGNADITCAIQEFQTRTETLLSGGTFGILDGDEHGPGLWIVYYYGVDAEQLYQLIQPCIQALLPKGTKVRIRQGPPGASERTVVLS
jgi:hypothetical protein